MTPTTPTPSVSRAAQSLPYLFVVGGLAAAVSAGINFRAVKDNQANPMASVALDVAFLCFTTAGIIYQAAMEGIKHPRTAGRVLAFLCVLTASTLDILRTASAKMDKALPAPANFVVMGAAFAALSAVRMQPGAARSAGSIAANTLAPMALVCGIALHILGWLGLSANPALAKNAEYGPIPLAIAFSLLASVDYINAWSNPSYNNTRGYTGIALGSFAVPSAFAALAMAAMVNPLMFSALLSSGAFCFALMEGMMFLAKSNETAKAAVIGKDSDADTARLLPDGAAATPSDALTALAAPKSAAQEVATLVQRLLYGDTPAKSAATGLPPLFNK